MTFLKQDNTAEVKNISYFNVIKNLLFGESPIVQSAKQAKEGNAAVAASQTSAVPKIRCVEEHQRSKVDWDALILN